ncbi:hypothetical protein CBM2589_B10282 [Cupriavidus taiwanensis]|uniref:Uncharacterized protein n=1 Tax=Cupriavidus taiwanensis TaxID=164546 RepID=A0A975WNU0_9BURK|nr:hypothetical protein CBM2589_B10282 [Cupriavidus taiwanensis]
MVSELVGAVNRCQSDEESLNTSHQDIYLAEGILRGVLCRYQAKPTCPSGLQSTLSLGQRLVRIVNLFVDNWVFKESVR